MKNSDRSCRRLSTAVLLLLVLTFSLGALAADLSVTARQQIAALVAEKSSRTPEQQKIDSNLLYTVKMNRGEAIAEGIARLETGIDPAVDVSPEVDIVARVSDSLLKRIESLGGEILSTHAGFRSIRARLPLQSLETLAAEPDVLFIQPKQEAQTWRVAPLPAGPPRAAAAAVSAAVRAKVDSGFDERAERVRTQIHSGLAALEPRYGVSIATKVNTSEGDVTHRADLARSTWGVTGAGVKIGVISNGVDSLLALQATGDLPYVNVLPGQAGTGDEGTAMLEIVYDLAPGAQLYFATANPTIAQFAQNIRDLRTAGCDIIVDDVFYFVETPFQKGQAPAVVSNTNGGLVTQSVNTVTAAGALYFTSAGNSGNLDASTSGTWEGDFVDGGFVGTGDAHLFGGPSGQPYDVNNLNTSLVNLYWSDPLGGSSNDYDLYVLDSTGSTVLGASTNDQTGTQDPYEFISGNITTGLRLVIVLFSGSPRFLHLSTNRGRLSIATAGETHGHSAPPGTFAFGVAATPAVGPYPSPFGPTNVVETFSSDGPRRYFFNADSTPITPGNFSSTGGEVQNKPDLTAADGVTCQTPGFNPFFGTSAAAPHAAAIAGLVKSAAPFATQAQLRTYLLTGAIGIMAAGIDRDSGVGILDAYSAVQATGTPSLAGLVLGTVSAAETSGNGNTFVEPGECGALTVQLKNVSSSKAATVVSASISTSTPGVTITLGTVPYPDIAAGGTASNATPFRFVLSTSVTCPLFIPFTLTVNYSGGRSPQVFPFVLRAGEPTVVVPTTLDGTVPPANSAYTAVTGTQTGRINRLTPASACGVAESNPGLLLADSNSRKYDAYTFVNCAAGTACIKVRVDSPLGAQLFVAAYAASFSPSNPSTNWIGDAGSSGLTMAFSVNVAASQTFVVVVHELTGGASPTYPYSLTVDGACFPCRSYTTSCTSCPPESLTISAPSAVGAGSPSRTASVPVTPGASYNWGITNGSITGGQGTSQIIFTAGTTSPVGLSVQETGPTACVRNANTNVPILAAGSAVLFYAVPPCRQLDTRSGSPIASLGTLTVALTGAPCGIPAGAKSISVNIAETLPVGSGHLRIYPADVTLPLISNLNFNSGKTRSNNAILRLSGDGTGRVKIYNSSGGTVHVIVDVNGYFQ